MDWPRFAAGVAGCYAHHELRVPESLVRVGSPLALARALLLVGVDERPGEERRALVGLVRRRTQEYVEQALSSGFDPRVLDRVRSEVFAPVDAVLRNGEPIVEAIGEALRGRPLEADPVGTQQSCRAAAVGMVGRNRVGRARGTAGWQSWRRCLRGWWESAWCGYAAFMARYWPDCLWDTPGRIADFTAAQSADWWFPHLDFVVASERPAVVRTEDDRLHCADGPALVWQDGWELYFWRGTRVPEWVIHAPTVDAVNAESNVEVRRCAIESMGWDAYLDGAGLSLVDTASDPGNPGFELRLYHVPSKIWGTPVRILLATNGSPERDGTRRRYALPVPADMDTALNAAAWTYGLSGEQYTGLVRRT